MNIVWFSWKDIRHPQAGGAENISWHLMKSLVRDGHEVCLITARYPASLASETIDGVRITRVGNRVSVYARAFWLYRKKLKNWAEVVVDEMNTIPFGCGFYTRKKSILLTYQLARKVWFYQMPFPLSVVGYLIEPLYLFTLSRVYQTVLTESESTRQDLHRYGFSLSKTKVLRVGIDIEPLKVLAPKPSHNNVLVLGAIRPMKRTLSAVKSFEYARDNNPALQLTVAGDNGGAYAQKVMRYVERSRHHEAIKVLGRVNSEQRLEAMREASLILVTSVKEGWGLVVTEANSQGTPAVAYDCDGLRDSITDGKTGLLAPSGDEHALGNAINQLVNNPGRYKALRQAAWESSKRYTFDNCYRDFLANSGIASKNSR